jgi:hypothetical protein
MNKLSKNIFYAVTIGLSVILTMMILIAGNNDVDMPVGLGMILMYILLVVTLLSSVALAVKSLIQKPKSAMMFMVGLGILTVLTVIGYFSDSAVLQTNWAEFGVDTVFYSRMIGGSIIATYIILVGAVALTFFASIRDFIKRF